MLEREENYELENNARKQHQHMQRLAHLLDDLGGDQYDEQAADDRTDQDHKDASGMGFEKQVQDPCDRAFQAQEQGHAG
jgi:hypothetical protein